MKLTVLVWICNIDSFFVKPIHPPFIFDPLFIVISIHWSYGIDEKGNDFPPYSSVLLLLDYSFVPNIKTNNAYNAHNRHPKQHKYYRCQVLLPILGTHCMVMNKQYVHHFEKRQSIFCHIRNCHFYFGEYVIDVITKISIF